MLVPGYPLLADLATYRMTMRWCLPPQNRLVSGPGLSRASSNNRFVSGCKLRPHGYSPLSRAGSVSAPSKTTDLPHFPQSFCSTPPPAVTAFFALCGPAESGRSVCPRCFHCLSNIGQPLCAGGFVFHSQGRGL